VNFSPIWVEILAPSRSWERMIILYAPGGILPAAGKLVFRVVVSEPVRQL
jgi:hypothetical protein